MHPTQRPAWREFLRDQDGAFSRAQALQFGITDAMIRAQVAGRRWQRVHPSTFVAHNGQLGFRTRAWAAVLFCGPSAVVSHRAAGYLLGLIDRPPAVIDVSVPARRRPRGAPGIRINRRRIAVASGGSPPRLTVEDTVLDLVGRAVSTDDVVGLITAACQRRLTTAARLRDAARRRATLPWRSLVNDVLLDADSSHSALEWRYLRDVERRHGLPISKRQAPGRHGRSNLWRDVAYRKYRLIVELDGAAAHPPEGRHRDMARDNRVVVEGGKSLAYGWHAIAGHPCEAAAQVAAVLQSAGWRGVPRQCSPNCPAGGPNCPAGGPSQLPES